jgi:hypothetical protein
MIFCNNKIILKENEIFNYKSVQNEQVWHFVE